MSKLAAAARKFGIGRALAGAYLLLFVLHRVLPGMWTWREHVGPRLADWLELLYRAAPWLLHLATGTVLAGVALRAVLSHDARHKVAAVAERLRAKRALSWVPVILWLAFHVVNARYPELLSSTRGRAFLAEHWVWHVTRLATWVLEGAAIGGIARLGLSRLAALRPPESAAAPPAPHEMAFSAIAVTPTTQGALVAIGASHFAIVAYLANARVSDSQVLAALLAYACTVIGGALFFRAASRIAVGLDGVLVTGSGRRTFLPWAQVDDVRVEGASIVVSRGARVLARLQPHGDDAPHRDALAARFREMFEAARALRGETAHVHAAHAARAGGERLAGAMRGAADYRQAALTHEQLWGVVEGAAAERDERALAAAALAHGLDEEGRIRLRVAAEHCADPQTRASIEGLLIEEEESCDAESARAQP